VYASWSQHLNRQIYHALAIADGYATEALGNIRTVKAFAAEKLETNKYDVAIATALQKGIIDAFGGAGERVVVVPLFISPDYEIYLYHAILIDTGMDTINSYLDLGDRVSLVGKLGVVVMCDVMLRRVVVCQEEPYCVKSCVDVMVWRVVVCQEEPYCVVVMC